MRPSFWAAALEFSGGSIENRLQKTEVRMKVLSLAIFLLLSPLALGAGESAPTVTSQEQFKKVKSADVAAWLKQNPMQTHVFDANTEAVRAKEGVVRGAKILTGSSNYIVAQTLPEDKNARLIFYCANEKCTASHTAAKRALESGYKDVFVMSDGIEGWKKAGQPTDPFAVQRKAQKEAQKSKS
jgi:rhodanese-related sulfurtransferase